MHGRELGAGKVDNKCIGLSPLVRSSMGAKKMGMHGRPTWKRRNLEAADGSSAGSVCMHMGGSRRARERKASQVGLDLAAVLGLI